MISYDDSNILKEDLKEETDSQKSVDFDQALKAIQFGLAPLFNLPCNMILVLPKIFQAKPNQPLSLEGDVKDENEATVRITNQDLGKRSHKKTN